MTAFSFDKLRSKIGRRASEPAPEMFEDPLRNSLSSAHIVISDQDPRAQQRLRASSLSRAASLRSQSRTMSKKQAKELIRHETAQVVLKKLTSVLQELELQNPVPMRTTAPLSLVSTYVANTNDCVYLAPASSVSFTYEDADNGGNDIPEEEREFEVRIPDSDSQTESSLVLDLEEIAPFLLPNYLCTQIDLDSPIPHLFGVVVELKKECPVRSVHVGLLSNVQTLWPTGEIHNRYNVKEKFKIGALDWIVLLHDADYFISTTNLTNTKDMRVTREDLAKRTRKYRLVDVQKLACGTDAINNGRCKAVFLPEFQNILAHNALNLTVNMPLSVPNTNMALSVSASTITSDSSDTFEAGLYVFLFPVLFPSHIPASITSINGTLTHKLSVVVNRMSEKLNRRSPVSAQYTLPMVRTPPSLSNSIADKPIYVNRIWNDAVHYVITFPRKYVLLGSEHTINVKLVPLTKDVIIKRVKFSVLERITYVLRDLSREYDYDGDDPFLLRKLKKVRERVVPVCELNTKHKTSYGGLTEPYKVEVVKCPDNNLLFSCYEDTRDDVMVASPLDINIALPFLTTRSDIDDDDVASQSRSASVSTTHDGSVLSPVIGSLETHISHMSGPLLMADLDEDVLELDSSAMLPEDRKNGPGYTSTARALAPDSNFRHIQIRHRLQVCFRISKPDPLDDFRMHHYEVVVDTPLVLLSARCADDAVQLPPYELQDIAFRIPSFNGVLIRRWDDYDPLPSFEEAISTPSTPVTRLMSLGPISRMNLLTPSEPAPAYEQQASDVPPICIDDLIVDGTASPRRTSMIHSSLLSSFAKESRDSRSDVGDNTSGHENGHNGDAVGSTDSRMHLKRPGNMPDTSNGNEYASSSNISGSDMSASDVSAPNLNSSNGNFSDLSSDVNDVNGSSASVSNLGGESASNVNGESSSNISGGSVSNVSESSASNVIVSHAIVGTSSISVSDNSSVSRYGTSTRSDMYESPSKALSRSLLSSDSASLGSPTALEGPQLYTGVDDAESVQSQFVQRLPLLQNTSVENIQIEPLDSKMLTDTLSNSADMFHAY